MARPGIRRSHIALGTLLVASLLLEASGAAQASEIDSSRQDARMLLLGVHSFLLGEDDSANAGPAVRGTSGWLRPTLRPAAGPIDEVKAAIRDLEAECAQERAEIEDLLPMADKTESIAALDAFCQAELAKLRRTLADLRAARDRSWFRRAWVGRGLAFAWKTIKQNRRAIAFAAITGGAALAKEVAIERGRAALMSEARTSAGRFLARKRIDPEFLSLIGLSPGEWPPSRARSRGRTAEAADEAQPPIEELFATDAFELPADGLWTAVCTHRPCAGCTGQWTWTLSLNLLTRTFESRAEFNDSYLEPNGFTRFDHVSHEGIGEITEDGMLHGPYHEISEQGWSKAGVVSSDVRETDHNMYGVISADLRSICISRGEDPGNYDIDYIRRIGREAFFGPDVGCEADCAISKEP